MYIHIYTHIYTYMYIHIYTCIYMYIYSNSLENLTIHLLLSCSVVSDSLQPHELQHSRLPCPSQSPRACSNLCPWSRWSHPTISFSVTAFSFSLQSFPASGSFLMSQLFTSGGQSSLVLWQYILRGERRILQMLRWRGSFWIFPGRPSAITSTFIKGRQRDFPCDPVVKNQYRGQRFDLWLGT